MSPGGEHKQRDSAYQMAIFKWLPTIAGVLVPVVVLPCHIWVLWYFWQNYARPVDKNFCSCSCWDTVFKGTYESGVASYKHVYFNATTNAIKMWVILVGGILALYECSKYLFKLLIRNKLRSSMMVLFCTSMFSHYYSWWIYLNYYNDEFYSQWNHQLFFTITELLSTFVVLHLANYDKQVTSRKVLAIVGIAALHILAGGADQFIQNVVRGEGYAHQVVRDLGFMIPDILHLILPLLELRKARRDGYSTRHCLRDKKFRSDLIITIILVAFAFMICSFL